MPPGKSRLPRLGSLLTEKDLADAAKRALEAAGVSYTYAAVELGLQQTAVTMALNVDKYPHRGHAARRAILRHYGGLDVEGPLFRVVHATKQ